MMISGKERTSKKPTLRDMRPWISQGLANIFLPKSEAEIMRIMEPETIEAFAMSFLDPPLTAEEAAALSITEIRLVLSEIMRIANPDEGAEGNAQAGQH